MKAIQIHTYRPYLGPPKPSLTPLSQQATKAIQIDTFRPDLGPPKPHAKLSPLTVKATPITQSAPKPALAPLSLTY